MSSRSFLRNKLESGDRDRLLDLELVKKIKEFIINMISIDNKKLNKNPIVYTCLFIKVCCVIIEKFSMLSIQF